MRIAKSPALARRMGFMLLALLGSSAAAAQDAVAVNPEEVHVRLENDRVRVLEAVLQPGQRERPHSHPASVIYVISGGKVRNHIDGGRSVETELTAGQTIYRDPIAHWTENTGTTTIHLILIELKSPK